MIKNKKFTQKILGEWGKIDYTKKMIFNISVTTLENSQCKYEISHFKKSNNIGQIALFLVNLYKKNITTRDKQSCKQQKNDEIHKYICYSNISKKILAAVPVVCSSPALQPTSLILKHAQPNGTGPLHETNSLTVGTRI